MKHKRQHTVTAAYLSAWTDPHTPSGQTPYVWVASEAGKRLSKRAPKNVFVDSDAYTVVDDQGNRVLDLEHELQKIEDAFLRARDSIRNGSPITIGLKMPLASYVVTSYARTGLQREEQSQIWQELLLIYDQLGISRTRPDLHTQVSKLAEQPMPFMLDVFLKLTLPVVMNMSLSILQTRLEPGFITSDNPVVWFDPSVFDPDSPLSFFGLNSRELTILFPVTPSDLANFTWTGAEGYLDLDTNPEAGRGMIDAINGMIAAWSNQSIVLNHCNPNPSWFAK